MKANYLPIYVRIEDLNNLELLIPRIQSTLEVANGYYLRGGDPESLALLAEPNKMIEVITKITRLMSEKKNEN